MGMSEELPRTIVSIFLLTILILSSSGLVFTSLAAGSGVGNGGYDEPPLVNEEYVDVTDEIQDAEQMPPPSRGTGTNRLSDQDLGEAERDMRIHLKYSTFDPLQEEPVPHEKLTALPDSRLSMIQMTGPTQSEWFPSLESSGMTILRYIPDFTYLVYQEEEEEEEEDVVQSDPEDPAVDNVPEFIRWTGPYHPAYKIDPELHRHISNPDTTLDSTSEVEIKHFPEITNDAHLQNVLDLIESEGGSINEIGEVNKIITAEIQFTTIISLSHFDCVEWIAPHGELTTTMDNIRIFSGTEAMHDISVSGHPIVGEVKDNGIDQDHVEFDGQLIGTDGSISEEDHGTSTFGIIFAKGVDERALGQSNGSGGIFCDWGVGRYASIRNLVTNWDGLYQSNSWHQGSANSQYSQYSEENDRAIFDFDVSMLYAAGNGGNDDSISQEAVAKNVISVGGLDHFDNTNRDDDRHSGNEGNKGPTEDCRIKPDLSGPYDAIYTTTGGGGYTSSFGGTSGATPVTAGALSLAYQLYMADHFGNNPSGLVPHASTIKALAIANAYQHDLARADRFAQGWGYIDMNAIHDIGVNHLIIDEDVSLETGQSFSVSFQPTTLTPLKISLVWTDVPGTTSSSRHLINDLDLKLTSPSGGVYLGNFDLVNNHYSEEGGDRDSLNNVENVFIENPEEGLWTVEILADNVPMDGDEDTEEIDQPFSLVASGVIREEHELVISGLDAEHYIEPFKQTTISFLAANIGLSDEEDLTIEFRVDDVLEETQAVPHFSSGTTKPISFVWAPRYEGNTTISFYLVSVEDEARTYNNWLNRTIQVFRPLGKVLVDATHGNQYQYTELLAAIEDQRFHHETFDAPGPIVPDVLESYTILATFQPQDAYSSEELTTIEDFVRSGGGLLVAGDTGPAILEPLTEYAGITWSDQPAMFGVTNEIENHNITESISELHFNSPNDILGTTGNAQEVVRDETPFLSNVLVAAAQIDNGRVVAISDSHALDDDHVNESDNMVFGLNIIHWINNRLPVPIIDEPTERMYPADNEVHFSAHSSYDPEGQDLTYIWISDREGEFGNEPSFHHSLTERGPHTITLFVSDGFKTVNVSVDIIFNMPPVATILSPGYGSHFLPGTSIKFQADQNADPDGDEVTYLWRVGDFTSNDPVFTLSNLSHGMWFVQLTVFDPYVSSEFDGFLMIHINTPPSATISTPRDGDVFQPGEEVELIVGNPYDADDDYLEFRWISSIDGSWGDGAEKVIIPSGGDHTITLQVFDGYTHTNYSVNIRINSAPVIVITNTPADSMFLTTDRISFEASDSWDGNGDDLSFIWVSSIDGTISERSDFERKLSSGTHTITLVIDDGHGGVSREEFFLSINSPPEAVIDSPIENTIFLTSDEITFDASSSNDLEGAVTISWHSSLDGEIGSGITFTTSLSPGEHVISIVVSDEDGGVDVQEISIQVNTKPSAMISSPEDGDVFMTGSLIVFDATGSSDEDAADTLSFSWASNIDDHLGSSELIEEELSSGSHLITLTVYDSQGGEDEIVIAILVNTPPTITLTSPEDQETVVEGSVTLSCFGFDADGDFLTYNIYLDEGEQAITLIALAHTDQSFEINGLKTESMYTWRVEADDGTTIVTSQSGSFTMVEKEDDMIPVQTMIIIISTLSIIILLTLFLVVLPRRKDPFISPRYGSSYSSDDSDLWYNDDGTEDSWDSDNESWD